VDFKNIDVNRVAIYEDFQDRDEILWGEDVQTVIAIGGEEEIREQVDHVFSAYKEGFTYVSCMNRVIVQVPSRRLNQYEEENLHFRGEYSQECSRSLQTQPPCGTYELALYANSDWSTFDFRTINLNQAKTMSIVIRTNSSALTEFIEPLKNTYIELDFISVVQQTWIGHSSNFENYGEEKSETHSVYVARGREKRKRAAVGQSEFFRIEGKNDTLTITTDAVLPRGNHLFTVKYRLVKHPDGNSTGIPFKKQADRVLVASRQPKTLEFIIPSSHLPRTTGENLVLFAIKRFEIRASRGTCQVEFRAEVLQGHLGEVPLVVYNDVGTLLTPWRTSTTHEFVGTADHLSVHCLGRSSGVKFAFRYRQKC